MSINFKSQLVHNIIIIILYTLPLPGVHILPSLLLSSTRTSLHGFNQAMEDWPTQ